MTQVNAKCQKCDADMTLEVDDDVIANAPAGTVFLAQHEVCPGEVVEPARKFRVEVKVFELDVDVEPSVLTSPEQPVKYTVGRFGVTVEAENPKDALEQLAPKLQERWQQMYNVVDIAEGGTDE